MKTDKLQNWLWFSSHEWANKIIVQCQFDQKLLLEAIIIIIWTHELRHWKQHQISFLYIISFQFSNLLYIFFLCFLLNLLCLIITFTTISLKTNISFLNFFIKLLSLHTYLTPFYHTGKAETTAFHLLSTDSHLSPHF